MRTLWGQVLVIAMSSLGGCTYGYVWDGTTGQAVTKGRVDVTLCDGTHYATRISPDGYYWFDIYEDFQIPDDALWDDEKIIPEGIILVEAQSTDGTRYGYTLADHHFTQGCQATNGGTIPCDEIDVQVDPVRGTSYDARLLNLAIMHNQAAYELRLFCLGYR